MSTTHIKMECPICNGSGKFPCYYCGGSGILKEYNGALHSCNPCRGKGYTECSCCHGTGKVTK